jgi:hypothetical protein
MVTLAQDSKGKYWARKRHPVSDLQNWKDLRAPVHEALREAVGYDERERNSADGLWREDEELRKIVRPVLADVRDASTHLALTTDDFAHQRIYLSPYLLAFMIGFLHGGIAITAAEIKIINHPGGGQE